MMKRIPVSESEIVRALRSNPYFQGLDRAAFTELAAVTVLRRFGPGEILIWQDEPCAGLHVLQRGRVKLFRVSPGGRELIVRVLSQGETFNEVPVFDGGLNPVNVAALAEAEVYVVEGEVIQHVMERHPEMAQAVIHNLSGNLRMLVSKVEELSFFQVTHRLARLISRMPVEQLEGPADRRLTQDELAARIGTVREVVARSLKELSRSGAIDTHRGRIRILDRELLEAWAEGPGLED